MNASLNAPTTKVVTAHPWTAPARSAGRRIVQSSTPDPFNDDAIGRVLCVGNLYDGRQ